MRTIADEKVATNRDAFILEHLHFAQESFGIQHHTGTDEANLAAVQDSRRDQMQDELLSLHNDRVACVMPTLVTGDDVELFS